MPSNMTNIKTLSRRSEISKLIQSSGHTCPLPIEGISGMVVDVINDHIYAGEIAIQEGRIQSVRAVKEQADFYILPAFIDAHVHIESSLLVPSEFARLALTHGVIATVSDPHEIANVMGIEGVRYMIEQGSSIPFRFYFGAPSCVPATPLETSGAVIGSEEVEDLLKDDRICYLSEMMNFPGVINKDAEVMKKISSAIRMGKRIDGHAPGLRGEALEIYIRAGISTDHETMAYEEGREKLEKGMKLLIREGSAAKNLDELAPLINEFPHMCMLCSDDKHPDDLLSGHINEMIKRLTRKGFDIKTVLRCASLNAARHYRIDMGFLQPNDRADLVIVDNLRDFNVLCTVIEGMVVSVYGRCLIEKPTEVAVINNFNVSEKVPLEFAVPKAGNVIKVIEAEDGQIFTNKLLASPKVVSCHAVSDTETDILKIAVVNRYEDKPPTVGFVKNFGLNRGAFASSVAHDSHNIIVVGVDDRDIASAVNLIIMHKGGLAVSCGDIQEVLALPVAGLMSDREGNYVARQYMKLDQMVKDLGCRLSAPFMTLSFMALLVIPQLKISDRGLFDFTSFNYISLFE